MAETFCLWGRAAYSWCDSLGRKNLCEILPKSIPEGEPWLTTAASAHEFDHIPRPTVYVLDDDYFVRCAVRLILEEAEWSVEDFDGCEAFLAAYKPDREACLVLDVHFPGMNGLQLMQHLKGSAGNIAIVVISGSSAISEVVQAMRTGASDFLQKPVAADHLRASVAQAFRQSRDAKAISVMQETALERLAKLTPRQREILRMVLAGHPSKNIAADLGISQRTVENHRAMIMRRAKVRSIPALAKLALSTVWRPDEASAQP